MEQRVDDDITPYLTFSRDEWAARRANTPMTLTSGEIVHLQALNDRLSMKEVEEIYLPISRLLSLYVGAAQDLFNGQQKFLGESGAKMPYIIGIAGSVAVGKSTISRLLRELLSRWPDTPNVELITTDGFLWPNAELEKRGLLQRKGFPESYDRRSLT